MRAAVYGRYGGPEVVHLAEVPKPEPTDGEVLVKLHASTVTVADHRTRSLDLPPGFGLFGRPAFGLFKPRKPVLGMEFAGVVEAVAAGVTVFKPGDAVFGSTGIGSKGLGCHAEYKCVRQDGAIALKPERLSFDEAAALPFGGETALHILRKLEPKAGDSLLVNGASGNVGSAMVQLAKHQGIKVTAVCSGANAELVRSLGADHVIDYTTTDFVSAGRTYDVIADCVGNAPFKRARAALKPGGRLVLVVPSLGELLLAGWHSRSGIKVIAGGYPETGEDMRTLAALAASGAFKPVIDRTYALAEIVEAHRYVDRGRKRGSVVIAIAS